LRAAGDDVVVLDLVQPARPVSGVRYVQGDVRDSAAVRAAMVGCAAVIHLAAAHHDFGVRPATFFDVNEGGSRTLIDEMERAGVLRACFYSSVAVYGKVAEPRSEESAVEPDGAYGASKLAAEALFRRWAEGGPGRRALIMRPSVVFGPNNFANMFALMRQIRSGMYLQIGDGANIKSMAYVENLVDATLYLRAAPNLAACEVFNYVDVPDLSSRQISQVIAEAFGRSGPRFTLPLGAALALAFPFDVAIRLSGRNLPISSARIRKFATARTKFEANKVRQAGFVPRISLEDGIRRMAAWFVSDGAKQRVASHRPPERFVATQVSAARAAHA
jgi:nucleoside-diphosphate-sugar epimerase